jgi:hypothetical protein
MCVVADRGMIGAETIAELEVRGIATVSSGESSFKLSGRGDRISIGEHDH